MRVTHLPRLVELLETVCPQVWIRLRSADLDSIEAPVVPLGCNLYGGPSAGLWWERKLEGFFFF